MEIEFRVKYRGRMYSDCILKGNGVLKVFNYQGAELSVSQSRCELQLFTGLKDKKGVKIFAGDYLVDKYPVDEDDLIKGFHESLLPVVWDNKKLMWCVDASFKKDGSFLTSLVDYFGKHLEVKI